MWSIPGRKFGFLFKVNFLKLINSVCSVSSGRKKKKRDAVDDLSSLIGDEDSYSEAAKKILHRESQRLRFIGMIEDGLSAALDQQLRGNYSLSNRMHFNY